jgi:ATP-dependent RNA helicase DOB1
MAENGTSKRLRDDEEADAISKKLKLGQDVLPKPEGGVNYIEIDGKTCTHAVALPEGSADGSPLPPPSRPGPPAKEFPFTLDPFQRTAIDSLEAGIPVQDHLRHCSVNAAWCWLDPPVAIPHVSAAGYDLAPVLLAGDSVLVAAHTSAGKTVIAQYACAMGLR